MAKRRFDPISPNQFQPFPVAIPKFVCFIFQEKSQILALFKTIQEISHLVLFGLIFSGIFPEFLRNFQNNVTYVEKSCLSLEKTESLATLVFSGLDQKKPATLVSLS